MRKVTKIFVSIIFTVAVLSYSGGLGTSLAVSDVTDESTESTNAEDKKANAEVYYTVLIWYKKQEKLREFEEKSQKYFSKYGLSLERAINNFQHLQAEGENQIGLPDEIQLVKAKDESALGKLFEDEDFQKLLPIREEGVKQMTIFVGEMNKLSETDLSASIFAVGFFYLKENGLDDLRAFEEKARPYFKKYALKVNYLQIPSDKMDGIGSSTMALPEEVQFMTASTQKQLSSLFADQGFLDLIPLRSRATKSVTFLLGKRVY